jgi:hypothetical protein
LGVPTTTPKMAKPTFVNPRKPQLYEYSFTFEKTSTVSLLSKCDFKQSYGSVVVGSYGNKEDDEGVEEEFFFFERVFYPKR